MSKTSDSIKGDYNKAQYHLSVLAAITSNTEKHWDAAIEALKWLSDYIERLKASAPPTQEELDTFGEPRGEGK